VPQQVGIPVIPLNFEVPVIGREPLIEHGNHADGASADRQPAGSLFAAMACVTLNVNRQSGH
jgi:hypothetical protein